MRIVYCGSGEFGIPCLAALAGSSHSLEHIFTQPRHPAGRGRKPRPTAVARWADENSAGWSETEDINTDEMVRKIAEFKPDLLVVIAFGQKIGDDLIKLPKKAAINVHASLLPKYRGAAPINWAIMNGEKETGISIIALASRMDAGAVLAQAGADIKPAETAGELHDRLAELAAPVLLETIDKIEAGTVVYQMQDDKQASRAPKLKKTDGYIDFSDSAESINNKIRGLWPWPGAQVVYMSRETGNRCRVTIVQAQPVEFAGLKPSRPGVLDENLNIICGAGALKLIRLKPAGREIMEFKDFANGRATRPGDLFMKIDE